MCDATVFAMRSWPAGGKCFTRSVINCPAMFALLIRQSDYRRSVALTSRARALFCRKRECIFLLFFLPIIILMNNFLMNNNFNGVFYFQVDDQIIYKYSTFIYFIIKCFQLLDIILLRQVDNVTFENFAIIVNALFFFYVGTEQSVGNISMFEVDSPYDQPTTSPFLRFSVLSQSSSGLKYSRRAFPSSLNSPIASCRVSCHGLEDPFSINLLYERKQREIPW